MKTPPTLPLLSVFLLAVLSGLAFRPSGPLPQSMLKHFDSFLGHSLPLGFILSCLSDCASAQLKELFRDEFDGPLFNTTGGKWVAGPFMYLPIPYRSCRRQEVTNEPLTPQCEDVARTLTGTRSPRSTQPPTSSHLASFLQTTPSAQETSSPKTGSKARAVLATSNLPHATIQPH